MVATTAITTEYLIVEVDGSNDRAVVLATGVQPSYGVVGINQNKNTTDQGNGQPVVVRFLGTSKCVAGGTITRGSAVGPKSDGSGNAVAVSTNGYAQVGIALESAVTGQIFEVLLTPGGVFYGQS
jgi:hypothetical protein